MAFLDEEMTPYIFAIGVFLLVFWLLQKPKNLPPGPCGMPLIGCILTLGYFVKRSGCKKPHQLFAYLARRYGSIIGMFVTTRFIVVLNDFHSIHEAFRNPLLNDRPKLVFLPQAQAGKFVFTSPFQFFYTSVESFNLSQGKALPELWTCENKIARNEMFPETLHSIYEPSKTSINDSSLFPPFKKNLDSLLVLFLSWARGAELF